MNANKKLSPPMQAGLDAIKRMNAQLENAETEICEPEKFGAAFTQVGKPAPPKKEMRLSHRTTFWLGVIAVLALFGILIIVAMTARV
jgi:hypothetical protein